MKTYLKLCGNPEYLEIWFLNRCCVDSITTIGTKETEDGRQFEGLFDACEGITEILTASKHSVVVKRSFAHTTKQIYENVSRTLHTYFVVKGIIFSDDPMELMGQLRVKEKFDGHTFDGTFDLIAVEN